MELDKVYRFLLDFTVLFMFFAIKIASLQSN